MPPAARVGDPTSHGNPLTPLVPGVMGSPNVFIGKKPAWRAVVDVHVCPLSNGPQPHVGGNVPMGSRSVLINKQFAIRQGDKVTEPGGGPNAILMGFPTVIIGG
ncbi:MAG TPA: PAAR domain-containing protein [Pyrinomonadaceae bacterium]|nr:PAAR domain-containing protein [Pyrinomonadaceae bacterium]